MGTKVQCKSYSPVFYSMRDLSEDAQSGSWPLYFDDKSLKSEQYYNCFMTRSRMDGYSGYDKEILKHTMLEHETVFRKQVYELHRLYRTQKDLMNEFKRKEQEKYLRPMEASHSSSPFSSETPSEDAKKMWQVPSFSMVNPNCSKPSMSGAESMQSPLNFIKGSSIQATSNAVWNGDIFKGCESLESKSKQGTKRMFDLQLPANEYVDSEGEQNEEEKISQSSSVTDYPLKVNRGVASSIAIKLSLGSGGNPSCQGDASTSDSRVLNKLGLADLNQPAQVEETTSMAPVDFLGTAVTLRGGSQGQESPAKPNYAGVPREFYPCTHRDKSIGSYINDVHLENKGKRERPYTLEAGPSRENFEPFRLEKLPAQSASSKVDFKRAHEYPVFSVSDCNKREPLRERAIYGLEIPESSQTHSKYKFSGSALESRIPTSYSFVPRSEKNSESSSVLSWIKPINNFHEKSIEAKGLPRANSSSPFNNSSKSLVQNPMVIGNEWHFNSNPRPNPSCGKEISYKNGFCNGSQSESNASKAHFPSICFDFLNRSIINNSALEHSENPTPTKYFRGQDCMDVKSAEDMNLNLAVPNGFGAVCKRDPAIIGRDMKNEDTPLGLPWLRSKLACEKGPAKGKGHPHETGNVSTPTFLQTFNSASYASETRSIAAVDCQDSRKILGFPIFDKSHISKGQNSLNSLSKSQYPTNVEDIQNSGKVVCNIEEPAKRELNSKLSSKNLKELDIKCSGVRNDFNLNLCVDVEENPSKPKAKVKIALEIDLEAPLVPETLEGNPRDGNYLAYESETHVQASPTRKDPLEELERNASEALVFLSSSSNNLENSASKSSEESLKDSLNWFADIVFSNMSDLETESIACNESSSESDYFESMTLKLTETKFDELSCQIWVPENQDEEETGNCALLTQQRRRGQSRRGRQRRDFQRDILPGLASLSRHEVTEDLQTFGGLMRATGHPWQSGLTRRNASRNGWSRGRKRTHCPAPPTVICSLPKEQPNHIEVPAGLEERSLRGWGKTTRRPRRQRYPAGTPLPLTHQV